MTKTIVVMWAEERSLFGSEAGSGGTRVYNYAAPSIAKIVAILRTTMLDKIEAELNADGEIVSITPLLD